MRESKKESIINEKEAAVKKNEEVKPEKKNEETAAEKQEQKPEIKKEKIRIFSHYLFKCSFFTNGSNIDVVKRKYNTLFKSNCYSNKL